MLYNKVFYSCSWNKLVVAARGFIIIVGVVVFFLRVKVILLGLVY